MFPCPLFYSFIASLFKDWPFMYLCILSCNKGNIHTNTVPEVSLMLKKYTIGPGSDAGPRRGPFFHGNADDPPPLTPISCRSSTRPRRGFSGSSKRKTMSLSFALPAQAEWSAQSIISSIPATRCSLLMAASSARDGQRSVRLTD